MTPDELRKLDAEVHEKVMGRACEFRHPELIWPALDDWCERDDLIHTAPGVGAWRSIPRYSTEMSAAWLLVEKLDHEIFNMKRRRYGWVCVFVPPVSHGFGTGDTAPLAICRAALKAVTPPEVPT